MHQLTKKAFYAQDKKKETIVMEMETAQPTKTGVLANKLKHFAKRTQQ